MGECRFLNVLLGMSLMIVPWGKAEMLIAAGIGVYIIGVTMFARTDTQVSSRMRLTSGFAVLMAGIGLLAAVPMLADSAAARSSAYGLVSAVAAIGLITARRCAMAIFEPTSPRVQAAVRHCVQSIIVLDAAVCVGYASAYWGFAVLALLFRRCC